MTCPRCQRENRADAKFCDGCGTPLEAGEPRGPDAPSYAEVTKTLSEALEQQTATTEILRVISSSPTDVQPVFDAIAASALRLCGGGHSGVWLYDGELIHLGALANVTPEGGETIRRDYPRRADESSATGRTVLTRAVVQIPDVLQDPAYALKGEARAVGFRSFLSAPMLRDGKLVGTVGVSRPKPGPFPDKLVQLLQTFADQAVIAIENVRLFTELQEKNRALTEAHRQVTEALEQQTATSEILKVISSSPTDVRPVFETIVQSAVRLCDGLFGAVVVLEDGVIHLAAHHNYPPVALAAAERLAGRPPTRDFLTARAILDRAIVHVPDVLAEPISDDARRLAEAGGWRTLVSVPLVREGAAIGAISVTRREIQRFSDREIELLKVFADQAVIAIENVRLFNELEARNAELTEALDQQTATAEILRVMSASPTDVEPVFRAIVRSGTRLCDARFGTVFTFDGELITVAANQDLTPEEIAVTNAVFPAPATRGTAAGRAIVDRTVVHISDIRRDPDYVARAAVNALGYRTALAVPMLREGSPIGVFVMWRREVRPFTDTQIALLQTFADQAVIAIENVRLFKELEARNAELTETLARQTATGEVLRAISQAQTDAQPVFDIIARSARRLCGAAYGQVQLYDGDLIHLAALESANPAGDQPIRAVYPLRVGDGSAGGRAIATRAVTQIPDLLDDRAYAFTSVWQASGLRSLLAVPMLRDGAPVGVIGIGRTEPGPFPHTQIDLLQTFADQAVIAIENVRLLRELEARNADLIEALEQQTATSEILRVISSSPTEVEPVFEAIVQSAARLCEATFAALHRFDGHLVTFETQYGMTETEIESSRRRFPRPTDRETAVGRAILDRRIAHIHDIRRDPDYRVAPFQQTFRTVLAVPLLREGTPVGAMGLWRREVRPFSDKQIELLQTFADQAVIAIENVRLFQELEARNRDLTQALEQQTATSEILGVISSSPTDVQPVFEAIAQSAITLCEADLSGLYPFDGDLIHFGAQHGRTAKEIDAARQAFPQPPSRLSVTARAILAAAVVQVADVTEDPEVSEPLRMFRTVLSVPMFRKGRPLGAITVARRVVRPFTDKQVALLQTFADQAVIAIENVRLFTELQEKNRALTAAHAQVMEALEQQTATSRILRVISSSPIDVQPVFGVIAESARHLTGAVIATVYEFDGSQIHLRVLVPADWLHADDFRRNFPRPPAPEFAAGRVILERAVLHRADLQNDPDTPELTREWARRMDLRGVLWVPMLREGEPIGVIGVVRRESGFFSDEQVRLLETFADQAVIAIENVRLFTELQARTTELTRSVEQLTALGEVGQAVSSTLDLETVLTTIVSRANQLSGTDAGAIYEYDEQAEAFHLRATQNLPEEFVKFARPMALRKGEGATGRLAESREPVVIPDIAEPHAYQSRLRDLLLGLGYRALLAVPLLREDHVIGGLIVNRKSPGAFPPETVDLLKTFATQSALAIQNARLFLEIEDKSRQLEAASRHKSEFLANMSHELRTPLNAIIGFSEVLAEGMFGDVNEKQSEYLGDILESGQHLLSLINDILDLSKIEAGRMELEATDFDLPSVIENALILVRERAGRRGITLGQEIDERLGTIRADERKVKQVLLNLLSNALKFTPEGGRIDVRAGLHDDLAEISVTDTGVGIAPEDQKAVFEEFRQVGTAAKKVEGTGLGLALSRKFIELHGGKIWVKSQVGVGSTFTFALPMHHGQ